MFKDIHYREAALGAREHVGSGGGLSAPLLVSSQGVSVGAAEEPDAFASSLRGLGELLFRARKKGRKKMSSNTMVFLVPTHSLTMNRSTIEISTHLQSKLTFKANAESLKTRSRWTQVQVHRKGLLK